MFRLLLSFFLPRLAAKSPKTVQKVLKVAEVVTDAALALAEGGSVKYGPKTKEFLETANGAVSEAADHLATIGGGVTE